MRVCAKKVVSDNLGLVDFVIGLVIFVLAPMGKCCFLRKFKLQKDCNQSCWSKRILGLVEITCGLVRASYSLPDWQAVKLTLFAPWFGKHSFQWQRESCPIAWEQWILHGLGNSVLNSLNGIIRSYPMYPLFVFEFLHLNA